MASIVKNIKYNHYRVAFYASLIISIALIVGGFFTPPIGEIHGSVLTAVGILFLYPTLEVFKRAIETGRKATIKTGDIEVNIDGKDNK